MVVGVVVNDVVCVVVPVDVAEVVFVELSDVVAVVVGVDNEQAEKVGS